MGSIAESTTAFDGNNPPRQGAQGTLMSDELQCQEKNNELQTGCHDYFSGFVMGRAK
jgi:hypothetical protein